MHKLLTLVAVPAVALTIGVAAGAATGPAQAEPKVVTKIKRVEKQVEVENTPQACLDALDSAEEAFTLAGEFAEKTSHVPRLIVRAARAGLNSDVTAINGVTADLSGFSGDVTRISADLRPVSRDYRSDAATCRSLD